MEALTANGSRKTKPGKGHHKESAGGTHQKETGKQGKGKAKEKTEPKGEASGATPPVLTEAPPAETLATPAPAPTPAPVVATTLVTPTPLTRAPAAGLSTPVQIFHRPRAVRHRSRARADALVRGSAPLVSVAAPIAGRRSSAVSRGAERRRARPVHGGGGGRVSRLVRTITRIVDVVPGGVRALIAGLLALALALAVRSGVSGLRARRLARQRRELLDDVGLLQAALLPESPERLGPVGTSVAYRPAAGPAAGGDFYDVFALEDGQLAVILGDVSGHGREALPHTALVRFTLRAYLEAGLSPRDALQTAGAVLERQLGDVFATVVVAIYEPSGRKLTYSCAGHPPPLVLGAQPGARTLSPVTVCAAPPIGMGMRTGTRQTVVSLPGYARVCFYTDGVTEARVGAELFGAGRLADELEALGPEASADALLERVAARADARPDDMAACVLSVPGEDDAPLVLTEELEVDRAQAGGARVESFLRACGIGREDVGEVIGSACETAGRAGTVVLEVSAGGGRPRVAMHRDHVAHLHVRRAQAEVVL
ncbi:MAG TPA: PP2C family protein-serine/threonine phosphatase [Solirubrobacteraceae bacterium]|nr:PP2C family protein-serine/threonine phosphatase [Solirubrobacteraceae bacterium]